MRIGICDDEPVIAEMLYGFIEQSLERLKEGAEIYTFLSGNSLLRKAEEFDAVFLDIEMPGMDGFAVGRKLKKRNPGCKIIMETGKVDRFKDSFKINAFRFVTKPFEYNEIEEALEAVLMITLGEEKIPLYLNRIHYDIPQKDIKYFKAFNGYTEAMVKDRCFRRDLSLNELEKEIDNRLFAHVHKQYIVNMQFITEYRNCEIQIDDVKIPVSRRKQKEFEKKYIEFDVNYRG